MSDAFGRAQTQEETVSPILAEEPGMLLHHVGIAVQNIDAALETYCKGLGFRQVTEPIEVKSQAVRVCFIETGPGIFIELVEGIGADSPVHRIVSQTGGGPYHLCFQVRDVDATAASLRKKGFLRLKRFDVEAQGMKRFAFILAPDRQVFELCDKGGE